MKNTSKDLSIYRDRPLRYILHVARQNPYAAFFAALFVISASVCNAFLYPSIKNITNALSEQGVQDLHNLWLLISVFFGLLIGTNVLYRISGYIA